MLASVDSSKLVVNDDERGIDRPSNTDVQQSTLAKIDATIMKTDPPIMGLYSGTRSEGPCDNMV